MPESVGSDGDMDVGFEDRRWMGGAAGRGGERSAHRIALSALAMINCVALLPGDASAQAALDAWPSAVHAHYKLRYNGIEVGRLDVTSTKADKTYSMSGSGKVSVLFGAVTWAGSSNVSGIVSAGIPQPVSYSFDWKNNRKGGAIKLGFKNRVATDISVTPPPEPHKELVPLLPQHKAGAFDPVSALLVLTRADGRPPCERRVEIFDGKQRYDIALSFKRKMKLEGVKGGDPGETADVCRAMYVPIAGHRDNEATKTYASNNNVEVVMRRVPGTAAHIPYSVTVPTAWGTGSMVTERIELTMAGGTKVAFGR